MRQAPLSHEMDSNVKRFLPTPAQARNMLLLGLVILLASRVLHEDLAGSAVALGFGLVLAGVAFNGLKGLLAGFGTSRGSDREPDA